MHYRSQFRADVRAALQADPLLAGITYLSAWAENIDPDTLPVMGVVTPSERSRVESHTSVEKGTLLQVVLKRRGDEDIEDDLDDDTAVIEATVIAALRTLQTQCVLEETTTVVDGSGGRRIGTATLSFRVTTWRAGP
ncbi:MAG: hypothetical protein HWE26_17100 [Alteromonadaceae bacterium]|nr:hypothetical protein [Alteromonadaceae bacterium]